MQKHITILGALYIAFGILGVLFALIVFAGIVGGGLLSGDAGAIAITTGVGSVIGFFLLLISAPGIIGGLGLLKRRPWARVLVLILGCLNLLNIPFGTILGAYTIWALTNSETQQAFARRSSF